MDSSDSPGSSKSAAGPSQQPSMAAIFGLDDDDTKVDFIHRTMLEREASGKRKIKPTYLPEAAYVEDSDDPDYEVAAEDSGSESGGNADSSSSEDDDDDTNSKGSKKDGDEDDDGADDRNRSSDGDEAESNADSGSREASSEADSDEDEDDDDDRPKKSILSGLFAKADLQGPPIPAKKRKKAKPKEKSSKKATVDKKRDGIKKKANKKAGCSTTARKKEKAQKKEKIRDSLSNMIFECDTDMNAMRGKDPPAVPLLCSICLSHKSTHVQNEVVQCDSCRLNCHEGCYIVIEDDAVSGTPSSSSTSPWFCDPCKVGKEEVFCELCPNQGGLFKETANRLWVHKVCAMYTPGACAGDASNPADVSKIPTSRWGGRACTACDDEILGRIGVPVKCDAAMCKDHFHVTCAQKLGLLSDLDPEKEADLFITCKTHISSVPRKRQAQAYKIAQEQTRQKQLRNVALDPRIIEKLDKARSHYFNQFKIEEDVIYDNNRGGLISLPVETVTPVQPDTPEARPVCTVAPQKKARFLENSSYAVLTHNRKVEFTHYDAGAMLLQEKHEKTIQKVSKMWNVLPGITVAFAAYYADRQRRITELSQTCKKEKRINTSLSAKEIRLNRQLEDKVVEKMALNDEKKEIIEKEQKLRNLAHQILFPASKDKTGSPTRKSKSPTRPAMSKESPMELVSTTPGHPQSRETNGRFASKSRPGTSYKSTLPSTAGPRRLVLHFCSVCSKSEKQHLIIRCDKCRKHFHVGCLDPPLTKKPRITSTCGWMCADCHEKDQEEEEEEPVVDVDAPRSLRGRTSIKKPVKYTSENELEFEDMIPAKMLKVSPSSKIKKESLSQEEKAKPEKKKRVKSNREKKTKTTAPPVVIKHELLSPRKKEDNPGVLQTTGNKLSMSPVVNLSMNGVFTPKSDKPVKRRSSPAKQSNDYSSLFTTREPFGLTKIIKCGICNIGGYETSMVKCDKCNGNFHFTCLTPPTEYTPKRKGFKWYCTNCDEADDDCLILLNV